MGSKMKKYKLQKEMEEGGTFVMHKARNVKKNETVAIKILKKKYYSIEECKNNKEVQVLQKLNHKNVLKMLELINDSNELLMVFEYLPENLKRVMKKRDRPFTEIETKVIMHQVFKGLQHIHKLGFLHRNLRPSILLCNEEADVVKISDFAMAKSYLDPLGEFCVSPIWYSAPEVLLGATNYSTAIDMWAAGCIMAEFLTGKPLFPGTEPRDQMRKICTIIGTFTPCVWPDGAMLRRSIDYSLPKDASGKGLEEAGVNAGQEAKGLVNDLLTWAPEKRTTADEALRSEFFKSDGEFVNKDESQEILHSTEEKLKTWREKWKADLTRGSLNEFERILSEFTSGSSVKDRQGKSRHTFAGFESNNPLLGDSTPRKHEQPQAARNCIDDPFRPYKPKPIGDQRGLQQDNRYVEREMERKPFEEELVNRGERKTSRQMSQSSVRPQDDSPSKEVMSPRRNISPRKKDSDLFGPGPTSDDGEIELRKKQAKAERMKQQNYIRFRTQYGDDDMRYMLGGKVDGEFSSGTRSPMKDANGNQGDGVRTSNGPPGKQEDSKLIENIHDNGQAVKNEVENKEKKAKQMKKQNYLRYRAMFGDDFMRATLGGNQTGRDTPEGQDNNMYVEGNAIQSDRRDKRKANRPRDTDLFPGDPDGKEMDDRKKMMKDKAEKLKHDNYLKFRDSFGDDFMRSMLGGKQGETTIAEDERDGFNLHWDASPRRRRESPTRPKDTNLFVQNEIDTSREDAMMNTHNKAELMKQQNPMKYKDKYGYAMMRDTLGTENVNGQDSAENGQPNKRTGRTPSRRNLIRANKNRRSGPIGQMSRKSSSEQFAAIDHNAKSQMLKSQNPIKYNDKYGDDFMRSMLGGNPREQKNNEVKQKEQRNNERNLDNHYDDNRNDDVTYNDDRYNDHYQNSTENMDSNTYSASWNDHEQTRGQ